ncbi:MAG: hypothetical protein A2V88_10520 [Elusimicrobia bacterium RBG_16_66_12]|nr:MAG: hypothetical protein A2V88_10520 [Elusimicrobia bacterium RBG_16_66_12]
MGTGVIESFFAQLLEYVDHEVLVTLFGGEPLLNRRGVDRFFALAEEFAPRFAASGGVLRTKIVTNGLLVQTHLSRLIRHASIPGLAVELNISIDGGPGTQARQRPARGAPRDCYSRLARAISAAKDSGVSLSLGMVAGFSSPSLVDDFKYLVDAFGVPIFVMPVDLTYEFITSCPDLPARLKEYARKIRELLLFLHANSAYGGMAVNLNEKEFRDLKLPPLGPAIDWDGSVYVTRDFLFAMDHDVSFTPIGKLDAQNLDRFVRGFGTSRDGMSAMAQAAMRTYFGRTMFVNKRIGDYFTRLVYSSRCDDDAQTSPDGRL